MVFADGTIRAASQALGTECAVEQAHPGHVAAGSAQTFHQTESDGIVDAGRETPIGISGRRRLGGQRPLGGPPEAKIIATFMPTSSAAICGKSRVVALGPSVFNRDILADDEACLRPGLQGIRYDRLRFTEWNGCS